METLQPANTGVSHCVHTKAPVLGGDTQIHLPSGCWWWALIISILHGPTKLRGLALSLLVAGWVHSALLKLDELKHSLNASLGCAGVLEPRLNPLAPARTHTRSPHRSFTPWGGVEEKIWDAGC